MQKVKPWKSSEYRRWISEKPCCICGKYPPSDPHHLRISGNAGTGMKPDDYWCIPLCHEHHMEIHNTGYETFGKKYHMSLMLVVFGYNQEWIKTRR